MFRCTQVHTISLGVPHSLEKVAKSLKLKDKKLEERKKSNKIFYERRKCKTAYFKGRIRS